jgi:signal transduction histidine kinase
MNREAPLAAGTASHPRSLSSSAGWLRFRSSDLEQRYLQDEYTRNRPWILGSVTLGLLAVLAFYPIDSFFVPPEALTAVHAIRTLAIVLPTLVGLVGMAIIPRAALAIPFAFGCLLIINLSWAAMLWVSGPIAESYLAFGIAQTCLFTYSCVALPYRWSIPAVFVALTAFLALATGNDFTPRDFWFTTASLVTIAIVATYGTVRYERTSRERFLAQDCLQAEYALRLAVEHDRSEWLGVVAGFVRHELKNAVAGVGSSLELLERSGLDPERSQYTERAQRSLKFMRSVLQRVANASSLESALNVQETEAVDFSRLVQERLQDFQYQRDLLYQCHITEGIKVRGNADSLAQMLDKILDNAVDHSASGEPVLVTLAVSDGCARLTIEDRGDPLPENLESLFHPFVTQRGDGDSHLGLGLYVAQVIARHHRGAIHVAPTTDCPGAAFTVELPALPR